MVTRWSRSTSSFYALSMLCQNLTGEFMRKIYAASLILFTLTTGSPGSKYEHRRAWALLRNIQNIRICMGKKPIVSVTYENERISIENSLPYLKCVLHLFCVVQGPIYGRFIGFYVNGFLKTWLNLCITIQCDFIIPRIKTLKKLERSPIPLLTRGLRLA